MCVPCTQNPGGQSERCLSLHRLLACAAGREVPDSGMSTFILLTSPSSLAAAGLEPGQLWEERFAFPSCNLRADLMKPPLQSRFWAFSVFSWRPSVCCVFQWAEMQWVQLKLHSEHLLPPGECFQQCLRLSVWLQKGRQRAGQGLLCWERHPKVKERVAEVPGLLRRAELSPRPPAVSTEPC